MSQYVPGKGNPKPKIVILGESPSYQEVKELTPFVGPPGKFLNILLAEAKINRNDCWITNVCKYFVRPNSKEKNLSFVTRAKMDGIDIQGQINELLTELSQLQPNIIIALGKTALWALTGKDNIQSYRGSILQGCGFKIIPTYHPAHILYSEGEVKGYWNKQVVRLDLIRAKQQSEFRDLRLPIRNLKIVKLSHELESFFDQHGGRLWVDTEKRGGATCCIGFAANPRDAICYPLFDDLIPISDRVRSWSIISKILAEREIAGQNFGYDRKEIRSYGFTVNKFVSDTMLKAFTVNPELPKSQEFLASIYTEEPYYKNESMYESTFDDLLIGCARDCAVSCEIDLALSRDLEEMNLTQYYENFVHKLHDAYFFNEDFDAIEQVGFAVDESFRYDLIKKYIEWTEKIRYELFTLTNKNVNTSSPKQVAELLYEDLKIPIRSGTGEEVLTQLLGNSVKNQVDRRIIELILEDRRVKKTLSSYLYSPPDFDGRMKTSYFICLETGRSATQQQEPPIREKLEYRDEDRKLKRASLGMAFQTITKHGDIGSDIRKMLVADPNHILLGVDASQAEARVIFLLADDLEALQLIDKIDYHALTTTWFFGGTESDYNKKIVGYEKPERFCGKLLRHAGHLGASGRRAMIEVNTLARKFKIDYSISEAFAKKALETFHKRQPKIREVFQASVRSLVGSTRRLTAPVPYGIDAARGGTRIFFERDGDELYRQAYSYIPQRSVSEHIKGVILRVRDRTRLRKGGHWLKFIVEAHDGLICQVPDLSNAITEGRGILKEEMERPIDFSTCSIQRGELIIPCELEMGYNYKEMK